jgi:hypothetical protein
VLEKSTEWSGKPLADILLEATRTLGLKPRSQLLSTSSGGETELTNVLKHFLSELRHTAHAQHHETMTALNRTNQLLAQLLQLQHSVCSATYAAANHFVSGSASSDASASASINPFSQPAAGSSPFLVSSRSAF